MIPLEPLHLGELSDELLFSIPMTEKEIEEARVSALADFVRQIDVLARAIEASKKPPAMI